MDSERWLIIVGGPAGWWVLAETPDRSWAKDEGSCWTSKAILSREEALLDPEFAAVVEAWDRADDSAHGAFMTEGEMDGIADEALVNAANAGDPEATAALEAETERRIAEVIESEEQAQERWPEQFRLRQEWYEWSTYVDDLAKRVEEALGSDWVTRELRDHALTVKRLVEERQGARMI